MLLSELDQRKDIIKSPLLVDVMKVTMGVLTNHSSPLLLLEPFLIVAALKAPPFYYIVGNDYKLAANSDSLAQNKIYYLYLYFLDDKFDYICFYKK